MDETITKIDIIRSLRAIQEEMKEHEPQGGKTVVFDAIETLRMSLVADTAKYGVCKTAPAERALERVKAKAKSTRLIDELRTVVTNLWHKKRTENTDK